MTDMRGYAEKSPNGLGMRPGTFGNGNCGNNIRVMTGLYGKTARGDISASVAKMIPDGAETVALCIGSDRVTGDCLGPLVGHLLSRSGITVYGTLASPVTALNVAECHELLRRRHPGAFVIAVDSALGTDGEVGSVILLPRGLRPAAAVGKTLPSVGDLGIVGVVSSRRLGADSLGRVRLALPFELASRIADGVVRAVMRRRTATGRR